MRCEGYISQSREITSTKYGQCGQGEITFEILAFLIEALGIDFKDWINKGIQFSP